MAGLNVALLAIPQGMAYAVIAEVPIYYGITCSASAALVAALFSGSRHTILGPTNATSFMVFGFFAVLPGGAEKLMLLPLLVYFVGVILVAGAYLKVADLIQYISRSVLVGYVSGAALLIIANQSQQVLGIELEPGESRPRTFFGVLAFLVGHLDGIRWGPVVLSGLTTAGYFLLRKRCPSWPIFAIVLALVTAIYAGATRFGFEVETFEAFRISDLQPRIPKFSPSGVFEDVGLLFSFALSLAFLAALENSVMSKSLASRTGDRPDANQDMLSIGIANLATSFFSVLPCSGSLVRSQLNFKSGAVSRVSSIVTGLLCVVGVLLLANPAVPIVTLVPKCVVAALVICIAISLINPGHLRVCLRATGSDAAVVLVTFTSALIMPLHVAIFSGVGLSIMLYLRKASRPELVEYDFTDEGELKESFEGERRNPLISIVHVEGELFFGAAELFRSQIQRTCQDPNLKVIVLRMRNARRLDATSVMALEELVQYLRSHERYLIVSGATQEVHQVLRRSGILNVIGEENVFLHDAQRPNLSTRDALKRAQELLGTSEAEVRIFFDPKQDRKEGRT